MTRFSGRRVTVGFKKEAVRGTAETSGFYAYPFLSASFNDKPDKKANESAYGNIVKNNDLVTMLKSAEGSLEGKIFAQGIGYLINMALGASPTTTTVETTARQHVWSLLNSNSHQSCTAKVVDPNATLLFALTMADSIKFTWVKDDFTKVEISTKSKASTSGSGTLTFLTSNDNEFLPKHFGLYIADNLSGLDAAALSDSIVSFSFEVKKNLMVAQTAKTSTHAGDEVDDIHNGDFEVSGSIEKYYNDTVYKGYDINDTKKAMRVKLVDDVNMAGDITPTSLTFDFAKVGFQNYKPGYGTSDISTETIDFEGLFSLTDAAIMSATLINRATAY